MDKIYYPNGYLKEKTYYNKVSNRIDSTIIYFEEYQDITKSFIIFKNDSVFLKKTYYNSGKIKDEGYYLNNENFRIGKWLFYDEKGFNESAMEYMNIRNKSYLNQSWRFNSEGDTLSDCNYYISNLKENDTLKLGRKNRLLFFLKEPFFSSLSNLYVLLPKSEMNLQNNFKNETSIDWDTIENVSLRYKKEEYRNFPLNVVFDLEPETKGKKHLKGILLETGETPDSISALRKIYFDITYYVN